MGMFEGLPLCAHNLIKNNEWKGGGIVRLDNALSRPSAGDVAINYHMLKPLITFSPDKVCSGYFITDCLLGLDELFEGKLLVDAADGGKRKVDIAAEEAMKLKMLMGAVRALWRSSPSGQHPRVSELKGMLRPSPSRRRLKEEVSCPCH
ncbi:unnamed protein product [Durusdinium trenchii]|uniref:Uncharacterized protein n=1 Tax=Durusdinium trenchii TaxID=1381693 RepID=A0ABP0HW49_9DINO